MVFRILRILLITYILFKVYLRFKSFTALIFLLLQIKNNLINFPEFCKNY